MEAAAKSYTIHKGYGKVAILPQMCLQTNE